MEEVNKRLEREHATVGAVTMSLTWQGPTDLDLHAYVTLASGGHEQHIYYQNKNAARGLLDVDMNANDYGTDNEPVENIFWQDPPAGNYRIEVDNYKIRPSQVAAVPFQVLFQRENREAVVKGGEAWSPGSPQAPRSAGANGIFVFSFNVDANGVVINTTP